MVMVLLAQVAETPLGKPLGVPIPVAPVVVRVMFVKAVFIFTLVALDAVTARYGKTVIVPLADILHFPPVEVTV